MTADQETGTQVVRAQFVDGVVKQIAARSYKFKQAVTIVPTSAWKNFFFRENTNVLAGGTGSAIKGIPRGADFPTAFPQWERIQAVISKYGLETNIAWEDIISDDIDIRDRSLIKVAEGVTKAVDDDIWDTLTENRSPVAIQSINIGTNGTGGWNETSAAIIDNLLNAKQLIAEQNYPTDNLMVFVSPKDYRSIMSYLVNKGAQFPTIAADVAGNGNQGKLAGMDLVVSNSVSTSYALVVVPKRVGSWKELAPLTTITKEEAGKHVTIRTWELGITQLTDPKAAVLLIGTQRS